jgi:hypothetical protein
MNDGLAGFADQQAARSANPIEIHKCARLASCQSAVLKQPEPIRAGTSAAYQNDHDEQQDHPAANAAARSPLSKAKTILEPIKHGGNDRQLQ